LNNATQAVYTDLSDEDQNSPIPLAWGTIRGALPICTNSQDTPVNWSFLLADTTTDDLESTTPTVYVNGASVAVVAYDAAAGTFTVAFANYDPAADDIRVDHIGFDDGGVIENGLDVIKYILTEYFDITYSSDTYDTTQWTTATASAYDVGLFVGERKPARVIIEDIAKSMRGLFTETRAGKWTFLFQDDSAAVVDTIGKDDIITEPGRPPVAVYDSTTYLSSALVNYSPDWVTGHNYTTANTTYEAAAYAKYKRYAEKVFDTILSVSADATAYIEAQMVLFKDIVPVFKFKTSLQFIDIVRFDNINVTLDRPNTGWYGSIKAQVIGIKIMPDRGQMVFTVRFIERN